MTLGLLRSEETLCLAEVGAAAGISTAAVAAAPPSANASCAVSTSATPALATEETEARGKTAGNLDEAEEDRESESLRAGNIIFAMSILE